ncbi:MULTISPECIES: hypothetical protein [Aeromonas]|uniref:hypothetical protein n=1 Tax=Aeromonas TaxID=642 RepID=UPI001C22DCD2|nr:hypothetical protein [Aeromonas sp. FDAARGOS 1404]QWZ84498.1 hypothetical protein I6L34_17190 [Aeromonas sp. FDAARGOS 1404]
MNKVISFIIMLLPGIAQALEVPQIVREKVKEQLAYTECSNLKLDDWKIYPNQYIDDSRFLYHKMVDGNDIIVLDIGAAQKDGEHCYLGGSAGTPLVVFIKTQNGQWDIAFDSELAVQEHTWKKQSGRDQLILALHGSYCNGAGAQECWSALELKGTKFTQVKKHSDYKKSPYSSGENNVIRSYAPSNSIAKPLNQAPKI